MALVSDITIAVMLAGALIGAIGGGTMFWQIEAGRAHNLLGPSMRDLTPSRPTKVTSTTLSAPNTALRAIGLICGGWSALWLLAVLIGQMASSAEETATFLSFGLGVGSFGVGYALQRIIPSMKRAAWRLATIWSLALIGAMQLGVVAHDASSWLSMAAVGVCGVVSAWVVLRDMPGVPRWQYGVIGAIWLVAYAIGSGYAWYMVAYKAQNNGWRLADTMDALGLDVFSLTLGAILSAVAGGVALYRLADRARLTSGDAVETHQGSTR